MYLHTKYLGQRLFSTEVILWTQADADTHRRDRSTWITKVVG